MKRICHITTSHPALDTRILHHECASLSRAGFDVRLIAPHEREETIEGVRIIPISRPASLTERVARAPAEALRTARLMQADLYHFHDPELVPWMRRLARGTGAPVVWDAHENYAFTIPQFNSFRIPAVSRAAGWWFDRMELNACVRDFAGVVTINPQMAARYTRLGVKTCCAANYPDITGIPSPPAVQRNSRPRFVSTGGQFADRGVFEILEGFALLDRRVDAELAFWGTFSPPVLADQLRARARDLDLPSDRVRIGGPYGWKVLVQELLPTAWAGCVLFNADQPNDLQGLPNRFFECWANGVPVVATAGTEVGRIVREEEGGMVVERNDPKSIAEAFACLAANPGLAERMGRAGRRAVESKYAWAGAFQNILALYAELGITP